MDSDKVEVARFVGQVAKVQTAVDGGFRIWFDGGNQDIHNAAFLMPFAVTPGAVLEGVFYRVKDDQEQPKRNANRRTKAKRRNPQGNDRV